MMNEVSIGVPTKEDFDWSIGKAAMVAGRI